jgi:hypothetical protein
LISDTPHIEAEEHEEEEYRHPGGKLCPKCKSWNHLEASMCSECNACPLSWRSEYKLILWLILVMSIALIIYTALGGTF